MKQLKFIIICAVLYSLQTGCLQPPSSQNTIEFEESPEEIVSKMTLEEKVGQLFMIGFYGTSPDYYLTKMITKRNIGGVILMKYNLENKNQTIELTNQIQQIADTAYPPIPPFISVDQEGGVVSRIKFEGVSELTAQKDIQTSKLAYDVALRRGKELRALGIHINYSPVVEFITDSTSFLYQRVFRVNDQQNIVSLAGNMLDGYEKSGVVSVLKHFPGHTNNSADSHEQLPIEAIESIDPLLSTYKSLMEKKPKFIMTSHVMYPKIDSLYPATLSKKILSYLRKDLNYKGVIISDDMEMKAIENNYTLEQASIIALKSGVDILLFSSTPQKQANAYNAIVKAIKTKEIDENIIDEKLIKILRLKQEVINQKRTIN